MPIVQWIMGVSMSLAFKVRSVKRLLSMGIIKKVILGVEMKTLLITKNT